jgi:hypothetical protein
MPCFRGFWGFPHNFKNHLVSTTPKHLCAQESLDLLPAGKFGVGKSAGNQRRRMSNTGMPSGLLKHFWLGNPDKWRFQWEIHIFWIVFVNHIPFPTGFSQRTSMKNPWCYGKVGARSHPPGRYVADIDPSPLQYPSQIEIYGGFLQWRYPKMDGL